MTILLHFGMQKTGSTSLQRSFHRKGAWDDCLYLAWQGSQSNALFRLRRSCKDLDRFQAEIARKFVPAIRRSRAENILISSENLPFLDEAGFFSLITTLQTTGHPVRLVGYVRKPASFMESIFQQRLKLRALKTADIALLYPRYHRKFSKFRKAGRRLGTSLEFWLFEPGNLHDNCIVQDFCRRTGLSFPPGEVMAANAGLSLPAIRLLYTLRRLAPEKIARTTDSARKRLITALSGLKGPKFYLHSEISGPVLAAHAQDIAWMEEQMGGSLAEDLAEHDGAAIRHVDELLQTGEPEISWLRAACPGNRALAATSTAEDIAAAMARLSRHLSKPNR